MPIAGPSKQMIKVISYEKEILSGANHSLAAYKTANYDNNVQIDFIFLQKPFL